MSGRKINDHSSWVGKGKNTVLPDGAKTMQQTPVEGFGGLSNYQDTTETIRAQQEMSKKKVHGHPQKTGHRH
jgi:hypothetical protein